MNPDANLLILQYRTGHLPADKFADEMRAMNFSTRQIIQIMNAVNQPNAPRQIPVPEPDGNVLPASQSANAMPQTGGASSNAVLTLPPEARGPAPTQPTVSPQTVALAREATARSEEGPTYGRPESALTPIPRSEEGPWYGRPEPSNAKRAIATARQMATDRAAEQPAQQQAQEAPSGLMRFVRGDFREGADQRIMDAMRRQQEESGAQPGKAEGGAATGKGVNARDAALHKALEIIHMMLSRH